LNFLLPFGNGANFIYIRPFYQYYFRQFWQFKASNQGVARTTRPGGDNAYLLITMLDLWSEL